MGNLTAGCGKTDWTALFKALAVAIMAFGGCGVYYSWITVCKELDDIDAEHCRYEPFVLAFGGTPDHKTAVSAWWFVVTYTAVAITSALGFTGICCGCHGCAKFYAIFLVLAWGVLVFLNFITVGRIVEYFKKTHQAGDETDAKQSYFAFLQCFMLFAETCVYLNAAWDAFDTSDIYPGEHTPLKEGNQGTKGKEVVV